MKYQKRLYLVVFLLSILSISNIPFTNEITIVNEKTQSSRTVSWIVDFQQNGLDQPEWYFNHLSSSDRQKIRQAFDWLIPRENIINTLFDGAGRTELSPAIRHESGHYLTNGTVPRDYNSSKALELLSEVFGYKYSQIDDPTTIYNESVPYFSVTLSIPSNNPQRITYATNISNEMRKIGIVSTQELVDLNNVLAPKLKNPQFYNDSNHNGYDIYFAAWVPNDPKNDYFLPLQLNDSLLSDLADLDQQAKNYVQNSLINPDDSLRDAALLNYQQWFYNDVPLSPIFQYMNLNPISKNITGFNPFTLTNFENWTISGKNNLTLLEPYSLNEFNPIYYTLTKDFVLEISSLYFLDPIFRGMFYLTTSSGSNERYPNVKAYPFFADWYNKSTDGKTWYVNLKEGLKWQDGVELNASDVEFTFRSLLTNSSQAGLYTNFESPQTIEIFNLFKDNSSITAINATLIKFQLKNYSSFFKESYLTMKLLPKHILGTIPISDWKTSDFNLGKNGSVIGNGPYMLDFADRNNGEIHLKKWLNWNDSYNSLISSNKMNDPVPGANVPSINNVRIIQVLDVNTALQMIGNGSADYIETRFLICPSCNLFSPANLTDKFNLFYLPQPSDQVMGYNLASSIWGFNPIDPCILYSEIACPLTKTTIPTTITTNSATNTANFPFSTIFIAISILYAVKNRKHRLRKD